MSTERRHLRFLITSALLVGPALGCGGTETETNVAPVEVPAEVDRVPEVNTQFDHPIEVERDPTGNPGGPEDEIEPIEDPEPQPEPEPETNTGPPRSDEETEGVSAEIEPVAEPENAPRTNLERRPPQPPPENRPRINAPPAPMN